MVSITSRSVIHNVSLITHRSSEHLSNINGIPSPAFEIFPGFNFVKIYTVTITQIPGDSDFTSSYGSSDTTFIFPAISQYYLCHTCGLFTLFHLSVERIYRDSLNISKKCIYIYRIIKASAGEF